jgi:hypothetical protein
MESISKIHNFARGVMWRQRLLTLQDSLALGLLIGGLISASLIFYIRWKAIQTPVWLVALVVFSAAFGALLTRWSISRLSENDAGFLIDDALKLDDRFATSQAIIGKSRIENEVEKALLEDASSRIDGVKAAVIVPYRMKRFYALSALALIAFTIAVIIPQKSLPGGQEIVQTQADIQAAGEQLEKTSTEIEKFVPPETVTAGLAKEQAELGRSLRRSSDTRADALKKLSSLEDRIRQRHDELKSTRADEIVALAQKRMGAALSQMSKRNISQSASEKEQADNAESANNLSSPDRNQKDKKISSDKAENRDVNNRVTGNSSAKADEKNRQAEKSRAGKSAAEKAKQDPTDTSKEQDNQKKDAVTRQNQSEQKNGGEKSGQNQTAENQKSDSEKNPSSQKPTPNQEQSGKPDSKVPPDVKKETAQGIPEVSKDQSANNQQQENTGQAEAKNQQPEQPEKREPEPNQDASNPLTTAVAEQTAKALPLLSEQLLKKAEDLKLGKMSAEDIKNLAQSASQLAKDLAPIAQSKEFQKTLEQLAKQVNPQQLEQIARELMKDEKLQRELQAAAKLLWENRQVKDMVAGLTKTASQIEAEMRQQDGENTQSPESLPNQQSEPITLNRKASAKGQQGGSSSPNSTQKGSSGQGSQTARVEGERKLAGQGREAKIGGQLQNRSGGDYVYSGVKPGAGAARVPYSSAYPQYRRQAERTVERSQVPTHMRSMIRNYFDAINPNGKN